MDTDMGYDGTESTVAAAASNLWNAITSAIESGYLVGVGSSSGVGFGLVESHSWAVLSNCEITNATDSYYLFRIRNPWGFDSSYSGAWRDTDTVNWSTANKAQCHYEDNSADGIYYI